VLDRLMTQLTSLSALSFIAVCCLIVYGVMKTSPESIERSRNLPLEDDQNV
jgi:hypothetical protein